MAGDSRLSAATAFMLTFKNSINIGSKNKIIGSNRLKKALIHNKLGNKHLLTIDTEIETLMLPTRQLLEVVPRQFVTQPLMSIRIVSRQVKDIPTT